jgi:hypothetical protein
VAIRIGVAITLWEVGPEKILAEVNASLIDVPFLKRDADQAALTPQTAASEFLPLSMSSIGAKQDAQAPHLP